MKAWWSEAREVLSTTLDEWLADGVPGRGAALSFYVLLSLGPLLVLLVGLLEVFLSEETVRDRVIEGVRDFAGSRAAETVSTVLASIEAPSLLSPTSILTLAALLFGATAVFVNIRGSLNAIWGIEPESRSKKQAALDLLRARGRAFLMVAVTGVLLALSLAVTSLAEALESFVGSSAVSIPRSFELIDPALTLVLTGVMFGAIFRTLPDVQIAWRTVWVGAFATAILYTLGKILIARVLAGAVWTTYYGPGASVVAFLAWVYFSAQIFYLGAEFTQVWSTRHGGALSRSVPAPDRDA